MDDRHSPYAQPRADFGGVGRRNYRNSHVELWNPNAAANWCLLFSPVFGAYLHMLNWRTLGEEKKEKDSLYWVYASVAVIVISIILDTNFGFISLIAWYFASARGQVKYIKEELGNQYEKKFWGMPILCGFGFLVAIVIN